MKRFLTLFLICSLLGLPLLMLGACNATPTQPSEDPDGQEPITPPDDGGQPPMEPTGGSDITLVENGVSYYRVVRSDYAKAEVTQLAGDVRSAIGTVTGIKPDIKTDWEDQNNNADIKEILVGKTNRKESSDAIKELSATEYTIRVVGNKIVIAAGSDELLGRAVGEFLEKYIGYISEEEYTPAATVKLPATLSLTESFDKSRNVTLYVTDDELNYVDRLRTALADSCEVLTVKTLADDPADVFDIGNSGLVIVAGADTMINTAKSAMQTFLNNSGRIIMLGGPAFETTLYEYNGEWMTYEDCLLQSTTDGLSTMILDTSSKSIEGKLNRQTNTPAESYRWSIGDYGLDGSDGQLFHEVDNLSNWDSFTYRPNYKKGEYSAITLYAKPGDDHTTGIYFELHEQGGVRWTTGINFVSDDWEYYVLTPADFTWFNGGAKTDSKVPDLNKIEMIQIGFAGQAAVQSAGHHSYYIADISFCTPATELPDPEVLTLDGISPLYEQYPITNAANIETYENQVFVEHRDYTLPDGLISCHPGRQGLGYANGRTSRFVPLLRVTDEKGLHSGYAAWMHIYSSTTESNANMEGSIVACFSATTEDFYDDNGIAAIKDVALVMMRNVFLVEGGTDEFIYVAENTKELTAGVSYVLMNGADDDGMVASVTLYDGDKVVKEFSSATFAPVGQKNDIKAVYGSYDLSAGRPDRAVASLTQDGKVIDRVEHEVRFWEAKPASERSYIYIEDGAYMKDGEPITFFGVNYMPSSGAAETNGTLFEHYVCAAAYDPDVVAYDLARIKDIGMNAISVFMHEKSMECNNMLHLIDLAEDMGIYVDLALRGYAYPLKNYNEDKVERFIKQMRFDENDNIIAYDIAWEERLGTYEGHYSTDYNRYIGRDIWDADFTEWVKVQYGSTAAAEQVWGVKPPRNADGSYRLDDSILNTSDQKYKKVLAAYYRFLDDQVAKLMNDAVLHMKSLAPDQLFSFRLSWAGSCLGGNPTEGLFDYQSLAPVLDFLSPEGYALGATEDRGLQVTFANAYARYVQPDAPVIWKEYGKSLWSGSEDGNFNPMASAYKNAADYYEYTLKYCLSSYTSGMYAWYYAGGFRIGENSDYGIVNPDGSDREVTRLLREYAPKFINQGARPEPDVLIKVERDDYLNTIYGMFRSMLPELREAVRAGKFVDIVHTEQQGFASFPYADEVYTESVGDTAKTGTYPLRYVNGMVKSFETYTEDGKSYADIVVCNTKQSVWRAGTVSLVSLDTSDVTVNATIDQDVDYLEEVTLTVALDGVGAVDLRFKIQDVLFGNVYSATVK